MFRKWLNKVTSIRCDSLASFGCKTCQLGGPGLKSIDFARKFIRDINIHAHGILSYIKNVQ